MPYTSAKKYSIIMSMKEVDELIKQYGLEEDPEFVIIPFTDKYGKQKRRYLLKRRFIRIVYADGYFVDYPLTDVIKATIKYPELLLSEALYLMYKESNTDVGAINSNEADTENQS
jgi:hypothetical protein